MGPPSGAAKKTDPLDDQTPHDAVLESEIVRESDMAPPTQMSHAEVRTIFFGLMLACFLAALNQTIIATALPTMGRHFGDFENLPWLVTSYLLTSTVVSTLYGKLSDIHGRRLMMLTAVGLFVAGSIACAVAPNMWALILGRALQGIGGGGILPLAQAVIADVVAPRERGRYQAYMGVVWVTSGVAGPVLGGFLAEQFHWSLIFWINVPLGLAAAFMCHQNLARIPRNERKHRIDLFGAALMMAAALPLLLALTWGGTRYAWLSPQILGLIALTFVLSVWFGWHLTRVDEPFLPLTVLNNQVMRWGTATASFNMGTSIGLTIYVPFYFEQVHRLSATESGVALIPLALTTPGSLLAGRVMLYYRRYKWAAMIALVCCIVSLAILVWWPTMPLGYSIALMSVIATGIGVVYPITTVSIQNAVPYYQVGVAMGAMNFFRALGSALAVAVMGAIILTGLGSAPGRTGTAVMSGVINASDWQVAQVFRWVFFAALVFLVLALICLIIMEERPLRGSTTSDLPVTPSTPTPVPPPAAAP